MGQFKYLFFAAIVGFVVSLLMRQRAGLYLGVLAGAVAVAFWKLPDGVRLWNARLLPFYYLIVDMLALLGVALILVAVTEWLAGADRTVRMALQGSVIGGVCATVFVYLAMPMQAMPLGHLAADGNYEASYGPITLSTADTSYLKSWAAWNFKGLESVEDVPVTDDSGRTTIVPTYDKSYPELHDLIETLQAQARTHGCGRAMWEYEEEHNRFGSTMEPMMLPFFTDGCIGSMEGLYFEASATTPYHFINSTELAKAGSAPQKDLPYATMPPNQADFDQGVGHLQMLGVKYYLAIDDLMKQRAAANPDLKHLADSGAWAVYLVGGSDLVVPLKAEPAVLTGPTGAGDWLATSACWYVNGGDWTVPLVADGPDRWQHVARTVIPPASATAQEKCSSATPGDSWGWLTTHAPETKPLQDVKVSDIQAGDDSMSFDVDQIGVPVMVKTSYFPNWEATGAEGPYRSTPNLMVVIPTANHVELHYGISKLEIAAYNLTFLGVGLLALLFVLKPFPTRPVSRFWATVESAHLPDPPE